MENSTIYIGIGAGIFTAISMIPQLIRLVKKKQANDISLFMLIILMIGVAGWIGYGCLKSDYPIIITNSFSLLVNLAIFSLTLFYKRKCKTS